MTSLRCTLALLCCLAAAGCSKPAPASTSAASAQAEAEQVEAEAEVEAEPVARRSAAEQPAKPEPTTPANSPAVAADAQVYASNTEFNDETAVVILKPPDWRLEWEYEPLWAGKERFASLEACPDASARGVALELATALEGRHFFSESDYLFAVLVVPEIPGGAEASPEQVRDHVFAQLGTHALIVDQKLTRVTPMSAAQVDEWVAERLVQIEDEEERVEDEEYPELERLGPYLRGSLEGHLELFFDGLVIDDPFSAHFPMMLGGFPQGSDAFVMILALGIYT